MRTNRVIGIATAIAFLAACGDGRGTYDASGVFEATEVIISAKGTGELVQFDIREGTAVLDRVPVGCIDTMQLHLKKVQLLANIMAVESRRQNISQQMAVIQQQIATQHVEQRRYENLVKQNAANQKQLDDIAAHISLLEKQLAAQKEMLENNNSSIAGETMVLKAQIAQIDDQIKKSIITSPIDGTVMAKYAEQGEFAAQGRALFKAGDMENMFLRAYITANQLTELKIGQQVKVYADWGTADRKEYSGTISWIANKAEFTPKTIQTRDERANLVYAIKIDVTNDGYIKTGMYGDIKIN